MSERSTTTSNGSAGEAEYIEETDEFDQLITTEDRVLVDFYADWCGPCRLMAPMIDELAAESDVPIVKVDIESVPQIASRYDVRSIPTLISFESGEVDERLVGMQSTETLEVLIE